MDKKQLPAIFKICPIEYITAYIATSKSENMKTNENINDSTNPITEHVKKPIILVL